jgi:hypothetical protein
MRTFNRRKRLSVQTIDREEYEAIKYFTHQYYGPRMPRCSKEGLKRNGLWTVTATCTWNIFM